MTLQAKVLVLFVMYNWKNAFYYKMNGITLNFFDSNSQCALLLRLHPSITFDGTPSSA